MFFWLKMHYLDHLLECPIGPSLKVLQLRRLFDWTNMPLCLIFSALPAIHVLRSVNKRCERTLLGGFIFAPRLVYIWNAAVYSKKWNVGLLAPILNLSCQWRSQGLPGWASRPPGRPKWGRKWRKFEEKWENLQENKEGLRKCSYLAHPGVRGWLRPCVLSRRNLKALNPHAFSQLTILRSQNVLITFHFGYENVLILRFKNVETWGPLFVLRTFS